MSENGETLNIRLSIRHVLAILSSAFLGLMGLLYYEVKRVEDRLYDVVFDVKFSSPPASSVESSNRSMALIVGPEGVPVAPNQACLDACRRAVEKKYGNYNDSHKQWCEESCSGSSSGSPATIFAGSGTPRIPLSGKS